MYYFTDPNEFTNRNRIFLNRNTSVWISEGVLYEYYVIVTKISKQNITNSK